MNETLKLVEDFAALAHKGQRRKYEDAPYIVHPLRVMALCSEYTDELPVLAAAILHDVLEDTEVTSGQLGGFLSTVFPASAARAVLVLVEELTDRFIKSRYPALDRRQRKEREARRLAGCSGGAQTVKYADILDNMTSISASGEQFGKVYAREAIHLLERMDRGDTALRRRAMHAVNGFLAGLNG